MIIWQQIKRLGGLLDLLSSAVAKLKFAGGEQLPYPSIPDLVSLPRRSVRTSQCAAPVRVGRRLRRSGPEDYGELYLAIGARHFKFAMDLADHD